MTKYLFCAALTAALLTGCGGNQPQTGHGDKSQAGHGDTPKIDSGKTAIVVRNDSAHGGVKTATAIIASKSGSKVSGKATFTEEGGKVKLVLELEGVPSGKHAVHLHEKGDCSGDSATAAGAHWNPAAKPHGKLGDGDAHAGDIGNAEVGADGKARLEFSTDRWTIGGNDSTKNILNHALIIHAKEDDYKSQPAGNAGARIGCGVVSEAK